MNHASLFTGIGGFDIAAEWMGWRNVLAVEKEKWLREWNQRWGLSEQIRSDIKTFIHEAHEWKGKVDIISGGDPCQPSSYAGLGKGTEDDRYLWPEMFSAIRAIQPPWVINENVVGTITNGILDLKIDDLESEGYTCQAYSIPAEAVGALHIRQRIWLIAFNSNKISEHGKAREISEKKQEVQERIQISRTGKPVDLWSYGQDANGQGRRQFNTSHFTGSEEKGLTPYFGFGPDRKGDITRDFLESCIVRMLNGIPEGMDFTERPKRIQALGNAVVPQLPYEFFKIIEFINQNLLLL